ncbi:MAG: DMT family transporter [Alphaproteobacteria bacterium]|nr:DMT family transporter [Alphaproteobacteria bacterium]
MSAVPNLTPQTIAMLLVPPFFWAGNVVLGRLIQDLCPPITLNFLRWLAAFVLVLPVAWRVLLPASPIWGLWRRYALIGFLGIGTYNSFQYLALQTSSPINITLVASSTPVFMLGLGALFFGQLVRKRQWFGAALSILGVLTVLTRGDWHNLMQVQWVVGDLLILLATASWAWYSWLLALPKDPASLRSDWAGFLMAQLAYGLVWSGLFAGMEWAALKPDIAWGWPLSLAILAIAIGPAVLAYRFWGLGVQRVGPGVAGFFANLTPLFAAIMSALVLGDAPRLHHAAAFVLIVGGIVVSSRK